MKFSPVALLLASASALTLPTQGDQDGAAQYPPNTVSIGGSGWGNQGSSSSWSSFPAQDPYASYNPYAQNNPYSSNPYQSYDPYASQQYPPQNPYNAPPPPPPVLPPPPPPLPPPPPYNGPDPNAPIIPGSAGDIPQQVTIEATGYSGNGCPAGTVSTLLSPDKTVVTFGFDTFQATIGPNTKPTDKQKNCQLHLGLRYPAGYQLSIMTATYHGYVRLDPGVNANFISSYYFSQAAEKTAMTRTTLSGPEYVNGKTYTKQDSIQNESMIWSPCGANGILNINNRIALTSPNPQAAGEISNDDATIKFEQKLHIQWRRCPGFRRDVETPETADGSQVVTDSNVVIN